MEVQNTAAVHHYSARKYWLICWIMMTILMLVLLFSSLSFAKIFFKKKSFITASALAKLIDPEAMQALINSTEPELTPQYKRIRRQFNELRTLFPDWASLYVAAKCPDGKYRLFFDISVMTDPPELTTYGEEYLDPPPALIKCHTENTEESAFCLDKWGHWFSVFTPVQNKQGQAIAVLGLDISYTHYKEIILDYLGLSLAMFVPGILLLLILHLLLVSKLPLRRLRYYQSFCIVLLFGLQTTLLIKHTLDSSRFAYLNETFLNKGETINNAYLRKFSDITGETDTISMLIGLPAVSGDELETAAGSLSNEALISVWTWAPSVPDEELEAFEKNTQKENPNFKVYSWKSFLSPDHKKILEKKDVYYPIKNITKAYFSDEISKAPGLDMSDVISDLAEKEKTDLIYASVIDYKSYGLESALANSVILHRVVRDPVTGKPKGFVMGSFDAANFVEKIRQSFSTNKQNTDIRLLMYKKDEAIWTVFDDKDKNPIKPVSLFLLGQRHCIIPIFAYGQSYALSLTVANFQEDWNDNSLFANIITIINILLSLFLAFSRNRNINASLILEKTVKEKTIELQSTYYELNNFMTQMPGLAFKRKPDMTFEYLSDKEGHVTGYTSQELSSLSKDTAGKDMPSGFELLHPDDRIKLNEARDKAISTGKVQTLPIRFINKDGKIRYFTDRFMPVFKENGELSYIAGLLTDITEFVESRKEVNLLSIAINTLSDGISITDAGGRFVFFNSSFPKILGRDIGELKKSDAYKIFGSLKENIIEDSETRKIAEYTGKRWGGMPFTVRLRIYPLKDSENMLTITSDVSLTKSDEHLRTLMQEKLTESSKMEAISRLAGGIVHDFNNILQQIHSTAELIHSSQKETEEARKETEKIIELAQKAAVLTRKLQTFSSQGAAAVRVIDLADWIDSEKNLLMHTTGSSILLDISYKGTCHIEMSPVHLNQMVNSLVANGAEALAGSKDGIIRLSMESKNLPGPVLSELGPIPAGYYALIRISDNGPGIPESLRKSIFEPFFTTKKGQLGLGLPILYGLLRKYNGYVTLKTSDRGTTWELYLPAVSGHDLPIEPEKSDGTDKSDYLILLVDKEPSLLKLVKRMLEKESCRVLAAEHASEAIAMAEEHKEELSLLISDVQMPEMDGYEMSRQILKFVPGLPVIFMTSLSDSLPDDFTEEIHAKVLAKPFRHTDLFTLVEQSLKKA